MCMEDTEGPQGEVDIWVDKKYVTFYLETFGLQSWMLTWVDEKDLKS